MPTLSQEQRKAIKILKKNDLVEYVAYNYYKITVGFSTGIREQWIIRDRPRGNPKFFSIKMPSSRILSGDEIPIYAEFEARPLDDKEEKFLKPFFIVQRQHIEKAGFINKRLMVQKLIKQLVAEGWIDLKYPRSVLIEDLKRLKKCDSNRFFSGSGTVSAFLKYGHPHDSTEGRALIEHFLDWGNISDGNRTLRDAWVCPSTMHAAIQILLDTKKDITRSNITRSLGIGGGRRHSGPKFTNPGIYYSIIKNFYKNHQTIYDVKPGYGSKLLAASMLGSEYVSDTCFNDMAKFVKCAIGPKRNSYDLVILSDTDPLSAEEAIPLLDKYLGRSSGVLVLLDDSATESVGLKFGPRRVLKAQMCPNFLLDQIGYYYFFIY